MGDVVNLRGVRKRRGRAAEERRAAENRAKFGRSKAAKRKAGKELEQAGRLVDGAKLDPASDNEPDTD